MIETRHTSAAIAWLAFVIGCGPQSQEDTSSSDSGMQTTTGESTSGISTIAPPPPGTTTSGDGTGSTGSFDTTEGVLFLTEPDVNTPPTCDFYGQDCFDGFKCVPFSEVGSGWTGVSCFPVVEGAAGPGEPCTTQRHLWSGYDDCDATSLCWVSDPETLEGVCVPLCIGSADAPVCTDPEASCTASSEGIGVCFSTCSPLDQDCPAGQGCYQDWDDTFSCAPFAQGGTSPPGEACEPINACDPGSLCLAAGMVPGCMDPSCCTSLCDLGDAMPPCLPGQSCLPWFEPGMAPPGQENVGACGVPM